MAEANKLYPSSKLAEDLALADYTQSLPLPVEPLPTHYPYELTGGQKVASSLFGTNGQERFQSWPERMVRSGTTLPGDVYGGRVDPLSEEGIQRTQDLAGLGVTGPLAMKPGTASVGSGMTRMAKAGETEHAPAFYSAVENAVKGAKQGKATAEEWLGYLKNQQGIKPEELAWTLKDLPSGSITKKQLEDHIAANKVEVKETWKGFDKPKEGEDVSYRNLDRDGTKYSKYQLPGGENYKELLLTLSDKRLPGPKTFDEFARQNNLKDGPEARAAYSEFNANNKNVNEGNYRSSHWDEPNVLAHIRMNDRTVNGKKTLHIEEIQSDWHQAGRKQGYKDDNLEKEINSKFGHLTDEEKAKIFANKNAVPDAPFKKTWDELALKKVIRHAAENGYDQISWTPGEAQAARYDLSKQVNKIYYSPETKKLVAYDKNNVAAIDKIIEPKDLPDVIGKEAADRILNNPTKKSQIQGKEAFNHVLEGQDLKVGGEGMKAFYDKMLVDKASKLTSKYGTKVEYSRIAVPHKDGVQGQVYENVPTIKITPELKDAVLNKGFPLFSSGVPVLTPIDGNPFTDRKYKLIPMAPDFNPFTNKDAM